MCDVHYHGMNMHWCLLYMDRHLMRWIFLLKSGSINWKHCSPMFEKIVYATSKQGKESETRWLDWIKCREKIDATVKNAIESTVRKCLMHWKRWKHVWNCVQFFFLLSFFLFRLNIMHMDFIEWFHCISFFILHCFFYLWSTLLHHHLVVAVSVFNSTAVCVVWFVSSTPKAIICGRSNVNNAIYDVSFHWMELLWILKYTLNILYACLMNEHHECVHVPSPFAFACTSYFMCNTLSLFLCENCAFYIWIDVKFTLPCKKRSNSNCVFLVVYQSIYQEIFRRITTTVSSS